MSTSQKVSLQDDSLTGSEKTTHRTPGWIKFLILIEILCIGVITANLVSKCSTRNPSPALLNVVSRENDSTDSASVGMPEHSEIKEIKKPDFDPGVIVLKVDTVVVRLSPREFGGATYYVYQPNTPCPECAYNAFKHVDTLFRVRTLAETNAGAPNHTHYDWRPAVRVIYVKLFGD